MSYFQPNRILQNEAKVQEKMFADAGPRLAMTTISNFAMTKILIAGHMIVLHRISSNHDYLKFRILANPWLLLHLPKPQKHIDACRGFDYYYLRKTNYPTTLPSQGKAGGRNYDLDDREIVCTLETILTNRRKS